MGTRVPVQNLDGRPGSFLAKICSPTKNTLWKLPLYMTYRLHNLDTAAFNNIHYISKTGMHWDHSPSIVSVVANWICLPSWKTVQCIMRWHQTNTYKAIFTLSFQDKHKHTYIHPYIHSDIHTLHSTHNYMQTNILSCYIPVEIAIVLFCHQ